MPAQIQLISFSFKESESPWFDLIPYACRTQICIDTREFATLPVNDTVGLSVPMKYRANDKTAKDNVCGAIFANFSMQRVHDSYQQQGKMRETKKITW